MQGYLWDYSVIHRKYLWKGSVLVLLGSLCVCEREKERERGGKEREGERERERERERDFEESDTTCRL